MSTSNDERTNATAGYPSSFSTPVPAPRSTLSRSLAILLVCILVGSAGSALIQSTGSSTPALSVNGPSSPGPSAAVAPTLASAGLQGGAAPPTPAHPSPAHPGAPANSLSSSEHATPTASRGAAASTPSHATAPLPGDAKVSAHLPFDTPSHSGGSNLNSLSHSKSYGHPGPETPSRASTPETGSGSSSSIAEAGTLEPNVGSTSLCPEQANSLVYIPSSNEFAIANECTNSVWIYSDSSNAVIFQVPVACAGDVVFDSSTGYLWALDLCNGDLVAISPMTGLNMGTFSTGGSGCEIDLGSTGPDAILMMFDDCDNDVIFFSTTSESVVGTQAYPGDYSYEAALYDPGDGGVEAVSDYNGALYLYDPVTETVSATVSAPGGCLGAGAYDPINFNAYFIDYCNADQLWVLANGNAISTIPVTGVGCAQDLAFSIVSGDLYDADNCNDQVVVVDPSTSVTVAAVPVGDCPVSDAAAAASPGSIYVANECSESISVISIVSNSVIASIPDQTGDPEFDVYDPGQGETFVGECAQCNGGVGLAVIDDATNSIVNTVSSPDFACPYGLAYDPVDSSIWVSDDCNGNVVEVSDTSDTVIADVPLPGAVCLEGVSEDALNQTLFVNDPCANDYDGTIWEVNTTTLEVSSISTGVYTESITVDPSLGVLYAAENNGDLAMIGIADGVVGSAPYLYAYCTYDMVVDATDGLLLMASECPSSVLGVNLASDALYWDTSVPLECAYMITFDDVNDLAYVSDECASDVAILAPSSGLALNAVTLPVVGSYGDVDAVSADESSGNVYAVAQTEEGGIIYVLSGATNTVTATLTASATFGCPIDSAVYPGTGALYVADPCAGKVDVLSPISHTVETSILVGDCPSWLVYDPVTQDFYVADECESELWILDPATNSVTGSINLAEGSCAFGLTLDPSAGILWAVDVCNEAIDTVSIGTQSMINQVQLGEACPESDAYDPVTGLAYVTDDCADAIYEVSTTGALVGTLYPFDGGCVVGITFDSANSDLILADPCEDEVYTLNPIQADDYFEAYVPNCPIFVTVDPANNLVYASDAGGCGGGVTVVQPFTALYVTTFPTGGEPVGASYDPSSGEMFVDSQSGQLIVISTTLGVGSPSVTTGSFQEGNVYSVKYGCPYFNAVVVGSTIYDGSDCENEVFAYSLSSPGTTTGQLDIGSGYIWQMAYDPVGGMIYATTPYPGTVEVISPSGPSLITQITGFECPYGLTIDGAGNVWVSDPCLGGLFEINPATNAVVDAVYGVYDVYSLTYDPAAAEVIATESGSPGSISLISVATASVVDSFPLPIDSNCVYASTFVPIFGGAVVDGDDCSGLLQATDLSTGASIGSINWGGYITQVLYDPVSGDIIATNPGTYNLDVVSTNGNGFQEAMPAAGCPSAEAIDPVTDTWWVLDNCYGYLTPYSFTAQGTGGASDLVEAGQSFQISEQLWGLGALSDSTTISIAPANQGISCGTGTYGLSEQRILGAVCYAANPGNYTVWLNTTDADGNTVTSWVSIQVLGTLAVAPPLETMTSADSGQVVTFTAQAYGGTGGYTYNWGGLPTGCPTGPFYVPTVTCTLAATSSWTTFDVQFWVSDSAGVNSVWSTFTTFTLDPAPVISVPAAATLVSSSATFADVGDSVTFSASDNSGSSLASFTYAWSGLPQGCATSSALSITCTVTAAGYSSVVVTSTDSNGLSAISAPLNFTVYPALGLSSPSASQSGADVGQSTTFAVVASGGAGSDTFAWSGLPASCPTVTTASVGCTFAASDVGSYTISVTVTDADGDAATSATLAFTVFADPVLSAPTPSAASGDVGQTVTFSTVATLGSLSYTSYVWSGLPGVCSGTSTATVSCVLTASGTFHVSATVTDSNGFSVSSTHTLAFTVNPDPSVATPSASVGSLDAGQTGSVVFSATASGGTGTYSSFSWTGLPSGCTGTSTATVTCADSLFSAGTYSVSVRATDSDGASSAWSAALLFSVFAAPTVGAPSASVASIDLGETGSVVFTGLASGGSGGYTYSWTNLPAGCTGATTGTVDCADSTFATAGWVSVSYVVTDSNGVASASSSALSFLVYPAPAVSASANRTSADLDQWVSFTAIASGGSGAYTYSWTGCAGTTISVACQVTTAGPLTVKATVTDSNGVSATSTIVFTVNAALAVSAPSSTVNGKASATADVGQAVTLSATASGGSGSYTAFTWSGLGGAACSGTPGATVICSFPTAQTYTISVTVTDSVGGTATSSTTLTLTVSAAATSASATVSASVSSLDVGQSLTFTATITGDAGASWTYVWTGLPAGCTGSGASFSCKPSAPGLSFVAFTATDGNGVSVASPPTAVEVNALPTVSAADSTSSALIGAPITFLASGTGGTGTLTYAWTFGDSGTGTGATASHTYTAAGTYTVTVTVTDAAGASDAATLSVTISAPAAPSPSVLGTSPEAGYTLLALLILVLVTMGLLGYMMLRRKKAHESIGAASAAGGAAAGASSTSSASESADATAPTPPPPDDNEFSETKS